MTVHELHYVRTGTVPGREDHLIQGGDPHVVFDGPVLLYYVRTADDVVLIDTSFHLDDAKTLGIGHQVKRKIPSEEPLYALLQEDIRPEDVTKLILTHAHIDHVGYVDAFPNAAIYVHRKELAWAMVAPPWAIGYGDFAAEKLTRVRKRLRPLDGERVQVIQGVEVRFVGGHTPGSLAVLVDTKSDRVCLCIDNCFIYRNLEQNTPIGLCHNLCENIEFLEQLPLLADVIIPGHDPLILERYPNGVIG